jgi:hypothetical protein
MTTPKLIPVECYLHRIFPSGTNGDIGEDIVNRRLFKPRKDCEDFHLASPIDWEAKGKSSDRNWRMQLQGWAVFQPIMNFFDTYEDQAAIYDFFFELAEDWWANYGDDREDIVTSRMPESYAWYDMSVGFRALIIAFLKNRIDESETKPEDRRMVFLTELARKHIAHLSHKPTFSLNNHGIFQAQGLMALAHTFPNLDEKDAHKTYSIGLMEELFASQFDKNGIHQEHSPHYHFDVLKMFEAVAKSGWFVGSNQILDGLDKARDALKWIVDPHCRPVCVGDSVLTVQGTVEFPTVGSAPVLSDFDSSGYKVLRSSWAKEPDQAGMLFLMGAYHSKTHKHRDCLSFDWFDRGERVICDGGKYGYKSDKYRKYCLSYAAHNTVEIEGFDVLSTKPYGSAIQPSENIGGGVYKLAGKLDYPAIQFGRSLYCKLGFWLIVEDTLKFARARDATQWFHLERDFGLVSCDKASLVAKGRYGRHISVECLHPDAQSLLHNGDEQGMQGFVSANDYEITPALAVGFRIHTKNAKVTTILALDPDARKDALRFAAKVLKNPIASRRLPADNTDDLAGILPGVPHRSLGKAKKLPLQPGAGTYSVTCEGILFYFYAEANASKKKAKTSDGRKLLIMLPGASKRSNGHIDFQRYSWAKDYPGHDIISISDPTLQPANDIGLAWFQYHKDHYGIEALAQLIRRILSSNGYHTSNVTFFGSSGGGFGSLQLADYFPKSTIIAINPQIYLYNYTEGFYKSMLELCYPGMDHPDVFREYRDRITVNIDMEKREAPVFILQNEFDTMHLNKHLLPFTKSLDKEDWEQFEESKDRQIPSKKLTVVLFADAQLGHAPPSREQTCKMITPLLGQRLAAPKPLQSAKAPEKQ